MVPSCWPRDNLRPNGDYHSVCEYNVHYMYEQPHCNCTNSEGRNNYWHYAGDMDCRSKCLGLIVVVVKCMLVRFVVVYGLEL